MEYILIPISAFIGGILQGFAGFGSGILLMIVLPYFFPVPVSAAISGAISIGVNASLTYLYRKDISIKDCILPFILFTVTGIASVYLSSSLKSSALNIGLGIFLLVLCAFMILRNNHKLKLNAVSKYICLVIAGVMAGLFGIGGPLLAFYFKNTSDNFKQFQANLNMTFLSNGIVMAIFRIYRGFLTTKSLLPILIGMIALIIGEKIASKKAHSVSDKFLDKCTYLLIGISGLIKIIQEIF